MKKTAINLFIIIAFIFSCDNDDIGSQNFTKNQTRKYSKFIPEIGIFNFEQNFEIDTSPGNIITKLSITSEYDSINEVTCEVINFKNDSWRFNSIDFNSRNTLITNQNSTETIASSSTTILNDSNTYISTFNTIDTTSISGHYEGVGKIISDSVTVEVFNLFGNINHLNQVLFLPIEDNASIKYIKGTYLPTGEFNGNAYNESLTHTLNNTNSDMFEFTSNNFSDTLNISINNVEKKLAIFIQKN